MLVRTTRTAGILLLNMPATRSSTRSATASPLKRKLEPTDAAAPKTPKKAKPTAKATLPAAAALPPVTAGTPEPDFVPADVLLCFSFDEAKKHLIQADSRFEDLFARRECTPYQQLEQLHPFRALASSILAQQISTLAARSIKHRFIRLYDASIPEKHSDYVPDDSGPFFPTPQQVAQTDIPTLRSAGLSERKAEYVLDLAARFTDGRLSTKKLIESNDEELAEMLLEVRGIGRWTVDMFAIFSLRRPDILPVGDLGVQRGVIRWVLSLHSPSYSITVSPEKNVASPLKKKTKKAKDEEDDILPVFGQSSDADGQSPQTPPPANDVTAVVPLPPTFTPSIKRILAKDPEPKSIAALPEGLTVTELKNRLVGKKKVKGALLSPTHMEQLTETWRPYRSLGVYYMWALADVDASILE
ncbi:DNA glycosylase [Mycena belliarum]|uniref:DNA glycosylase n=1 Tax=Mycena belliarum TaxID=1033014 RepID=A0AAD6U397_9AGAR|nr:DNA glycosylase [Mycena belliae]